MFKKNNGELMIGMDGMILVMLEVVLDPKVGREIKQRAQRVLNEFVKEGKAKGCKDIEKTIFRGVIDKLTIQKVKEMGKDMTPQDLSRVFNNAGVYLKIED